jgi:hypothetical protein
MLSINKFEMVNIALNFPQIEWWKPLNEILAKRNIIARKLLDHPTDLDEKRNLQEMFDWCNNDIKRYLGL